MRLIRCDHCKKELVQGAAEIVSVDLAFHPALQPARGIHADICGEACLVAWLETLSTHARDAIAAVTKPLQ